MHNVQLYSSALNRDKKERQYCMLSKDSVRGEPGREVPSYAADGYTNAAAFLGEESPLLSAGTFLRKNHRATAGDSRLNARDSRSRHFRGERKQGCHHHDCQPNRTPPVVGQISFHSFLLSSYPIQRSGCPYYSGCPQRCGLKLSQAFFGGHRISPSKTVTAGPVMKTVSVSSSYLIRRSPPSRCTSTSGSVRPSR